MLFLEVMLLVSKILEKNEMWFFGLIPLIVGLLFVLRDFGMMILPAQMTLWPTMVFVFGLVYVLVKMMK